MKELKIIVCIKEVPDPEGPSSAFEIDSEAKEVIPVGIPPVINPFDESALEAALLIKDNYKGRVIAVSMAEKTVSPVLKKALSVGVDELIILEDGHYKDLNSTSVAYVLSAAIRKIGGYDVILVGRQAADWNFGQVGSIIAGILQIPSISLVQKVKIEDGKVIAEKLGRNGYEIIKAPMPSLIVVTSGIGDLRLPSLKDIKEAYKRPFNVWHLADLDIDPQRLQARSIYRLLPPPSRRRECVFIDGESPQEKGERLALKLQENKVI